MTEPGMYMSYARHMSEQEPAAKPPVREADQWKGSGGTGRFPQQKPACEQSSELEREERRLERLRLVVAAWPTADRFDNDDDGPAAA
jgi:hypothetical protein